MDDMEESKDIPEAQRLNREAVGFIRSYVGKGRMTHQYNIRYGFMRNLMGGAVWACGGSIGNSLIYGLQKSWAPMALFIFCASFFLAILFSRNQFY